MPSSGLATAALLLLLLIVATSAMACVEQEKSSLLRFIAELSQDGGIAMLWQNGTDCCVWEGITCNEDGAVIEVHLASKGLEGQISPSLGELTSLSRLNLSYNSLSGGLPAELMSSGSIVILDVSFNRLNGDLQELNPSVSDQPLQVLNISSNRFTGEFPSITWEKMRNLVAINASNNSFTGHIPSSFCSSSTSFAVLDLGYNQFSGNIPPGIGKCSALRLLKADDNNIKGSLPGDLFNATSLEYLSFANNGLQGTIDDALVVKLINLLQVLNISTNNLHGEIPESICQLKKLEVIRLSNNNMSGNLPSSLGNCTRLTTIDLKMNSFGGDLGRVDFSSLHNLRALDLLHNNFSGVIPESIYSCNNLTALRLSSNQIHGEISSKIGDLKYLSFVLNISTNNLHGEIPESICQLKKLEVIRLSNNNMSGNLPSSLGNCTRLTTIDLKMNSFGGDLGRVDFSSLHNLRALDLLHNNFSGVIPESIYSCNNLTALRLSSNQIHGEISSKIGDLKYLSFVSITENSFSDIAKTLHAFKSSRNLTTLFIGENFWGEVIPQDETIESLESIRHLSIYRCSLIGNIPLWLSKLKNLEVLDLSNNQLTGPMPSWLNSFNNLFYLDRSARCGRKKRRIGGGGAPAEAAHLRRRRRTYGGGSADESAGAWRRFTAVHGARKLVPVPPALDGLNCVEAVNNNLSGELPSSLGECTNLVTINLRRNKLEGELAKVNFSNLPNLKKIDFGSNNFTGTIPESIYSCSNLTWLRLSSNRLHGQLTKNIGNLKSITFLSLSYNNFTNITNTLHILKSLRNLTVLLIGGNFKNEAMPQDEAIDGFENILCLAIEDCALSGKIPNWFSKLRNLQILVLHNNQLNGPIPTWTSSLKFLKYVDISNNSLTGEIPAALMEMTMLKSDKVADNSDSRAFPLPVYAGACLCFQYHTATALPKMLNLGNNKFTGAIPMEIGELKALVSLNLSFNNLNSEIPQSMNNLKNLMVLDLSYNHLTGAIPPALMNLHFLSKFNVSYNDLEGPVPIGGQFSTFPSSSFAGNPKLCSPMLLHHCNSAEEDLSSLNSTKEYVNKVVFVIAFWAMARLVFNVAEAPVGFRVGGWMTREPMSPTNMRRSLTMSWRNNTDCCTWDGIICSMDGAVTELLLSSRGLEGQISPSLGELTSLSRLNLSYNSLSGGLPVELMSSSSIIVLDVCFNRLGREVQELNSSVLNISSNRFTGDFPSTTWEKMRNLVVINASNNSFTGYIPSSFCISSPSFTVLDLSYNRFSGNIPPGIGNCSALKMFKAGYNNISGTLPDELFDAISLEYLSFPNNGLQGRIDGTHLTKLKNLATLDLRWNQLTGKIPDSINQLKQLEELHLCSNMMSGELPGKLGSCTNLKVIDLKHNNFYGDLGKVDFSALHNLRTLDLYLNNFTGTIPVSIYSCRNLKALRLSANHLHGELSSGIINLKYLSFLSLANNNFTNITNALQVLKSCRTMTTLLIGRNFRGEIMPQDENIDGFGNLQVLDISGCLLSGNIPQWISRLKNLEMLILSANRLTEPIPGWINSLNLLFFIDMSDNRLTEEIPINLMNMTMLRSEKYVTHVDPRVFEIPVYNGPSLQYRALTAFPTLLNLSYNSFTGEISPIIGQLEVHVLDFSFNNLSGKIPQSICKPAGSTLKGLSQTGGQFDTFPDSSFRGNPKICSPIVARRCNSTEEALTSPISTKQYIDKTVFVIAFGVSFGVGVTSLKLCSDLKYSHYSKAYSVAPQSPAPSKMNTPKENLIGQLVICQRDSVNAVYAPKSRKLGRN
uniref:non-specific serine/threonine protein kinase n=1 Tax=Oryza meridionalis TaxID=40149 RepID=A0A0E0CFT7_9ORYZ